MSAQELLRAGQLDEALAALTQQVRENPADAKSRVFMFQLLAVVGKWDRAVTQLKLCGEMDPAAIPMVQTYTDALGCEALRRQVFEGLRSPLVFGDPENWVALLMQAASLAGQGKFAESQPLREQAFEEAPATAGTIDGQPFEWIADADSRLGPVLEAVLNGRYYWIPFNRIKKINFEAPEDLRDVVWTPGYFTWANGGEMVGLVPTRYAGSEAHEDAQIRLARKTDWEAHEGDFYQGSGQRLLATDAGDFGLMDVREIVFDVEMEDASGQSEEPDEQDGG